ncbi:MAG TPA: hypothetical protein VFS43_31510 [Polyangiaceae bacterium]|nr:hypothetical protein [Polyangiaceae bacterium]
MRRTPGAKKFAPLATPARPARRRNQKLDRSDRIPVKSPDDVGAARPSLFPPRRNEMRYLAQLINFLAQNDLVFTKSEKVKITVQRDEGIPGRAGVRA